MMRSSAYSSSGINTPEPLAQRLPLGEGRSQSGMQSRTAQQESKVLRSQYNKVR
ncbi:TPA: hypothetical protein ACH3X1_005653 [Trebouxia sp. C0004]